MNNTDKKIESCSFCEAKNAVKSCGICEKKVCKKCVVSLDRYYFSLKETVDPILTHGNYCSTCYDSFVLLEKIKYDELSMSAHEIYYLSKDYPGHVRVFQRHTKRVVVKESNDRRETILRLAYMAAELKFNAIIEAEVSSSKTRTGGYQSLIWKGSAMPAKIDAAQLEKSSLKRL
jgi:uncharacterized protein YbjQ (UPF0145 family)